VAESTRQTVGVCVVERTNLNRLAINHNCDSGCRFLSNSEVMLGDMSYAKAHVRLISVVKPVFASVRY
jgi:hypothetical protein